MVSITLENIVAKKNGRIVLNNVSFHIEQGEYIGLLGPTGSGPSFTLKVIAGINPIESGKLSINGEDMTNVPPEDRNTGFIFEQFNLFPHMTVMDNVLYGPRMRTLNLDEKKREAREILRMVRLDGREGAYPKELSGGMQQRVGIARAVVSGAQILLLDQPYRALDAKIKAEMRFEISELVKELGLTALHSTHETEEAMMISDRIAIFNQGKLQQIGSPEDIFEQPTNQFVAGFLAESNLYTGSVENQKLEVNGIHFRTKSDLSGPVDVIIRHHAVKLSLDGDMEESENIFSGRITKIRVLGEFIRFNIKLKSGLEIISRQLLSLQWRNPQRLLRKPAFIAIRPEDIKVFARGKDKHQKYS